MEALIKALEVVDALVEREMVRTEVETEDDNDNALRLDSDDLDDDDDGDLLDFGVEKDIILVVLELSVDGIFEELDFCNGLEVVDLIDELEA